MSVNMRANVVIEKGDLLDVACDLYGASEVFDDIGVLLHDIIHNQPSMNQVKSLARLIQSQSNQWAALLECQQKNLEDVIGHKVIEDM